MMMIIGGTRSFRYMSKDKESSKIGIIEILSDNAHGNAKIRDFGWTAISVRDVVRLSRVSKVEAMV